MPHRFGFGKTGKADLPAPFETPEARIDCWQLGEIDAGLLGRADLENQRLLEHQRTVAGDGLRFTVFVRGGGRPPARRIDGHWTTSFSAASRAPMSPSVAVSVTATTSPFCSASAPG